MATDELYYYINLNLDGNELRNARVELFENQVNAENYPPAEYDGRVAYHKDGGTGYLYYCDGSDWRPLATGSDVGSSISAALESVWESIDTLSKGLDGTLHFRGSTGTLPYGPAVGEVWNIRTDTGKLTLSDDDLALFVDPPVSKTLPDGTDIVYTTSGWDILGGAGGTTGFRTSIKVSGTSYIVRHNLGVVPSVQVFDSTGYRVIPGIKADANTVTLSFYENPNATFTVVCTV